MKKEGIQTRNRKLSNKKKKKKNPFNQSCDQATSQQGSIQETEPMDPPALQTPNFMYQDPNVQANGAFKSVSSERGFDNAVYHHQQIYGTHLRLDSDTKVIDFFFFFLRDFIFKKT